MAEGAAWRERPEFPSARFVSPRQSQQCEVRASLSPSGFSASLAGGISFAIASDKMEIDLHAHAWCKFATVTRRQKESRGQARQPGAQALDASNGPLGSLYLGHHLLD